MIYIKEPTPGIIILMTYILEHIILILQNQYELTLIKILGYFTVYRFYKNYQKMFIIFINGFKTNNNNNL